ncbi:MAG: lipid A biosynthesis acyltransferase [Gammaproteobacteria bacterium]|jgi:KDO2-lipid IV(A) lauroyltransferase|nr:lipid A biosynthesis acyltransferase [Gammaproteobacteria bacterium]MDP7093340.1 lipid A biosynthesis acyltransferase [Gammaproteobacteria bacterium]MDP7270298.1 lipid A biosynthesis acyltransferase [Gammaproteobacteria bacterium]HJP05264.1 lipid A biosynthesis acyltransferase [Gammaproteobacteria bacterium]
MKASLTPLYRFWQPRYWLTWVGIGLLRLVVALPQSARMSCGRVMGRCVRLISNRRPIVARNLELCFPELPAREREKMGRKHAESVGMSAIELGMNFWCSDAELERLFELRGTEHLLAGLEEGHGVLLLCGHFIYTELGCRLLKKLAPSMAAMYRPSGKLLSDNLMHRCRRNSYDILVSKDNVRGMLRLLKENRPVIYAPDQAYTGKSMALIPFFGEPAATNTATRQIAQISKAPVVPFFTYRLENGTGYCVELQPALKDFPGESAEADALTINRVLEEQIRRVPEQYYWVHRRFKGRGPDYPDPYA